jgi:hypothetical protein
MKSVLKTSRFLYELPSLTTSKMLNWPQPSASAQLEVFAKHWQAAYAPARESSPTPVPSQGASHHPPMLIWVAADAQVGTAWAVPS